MRIFPKKSSLAVIAALGMLAAPVGAIGNSMQSMFDEINGYGNVTGPGAYQGQTMGLYTGGSVYMRTPQRSYSLVSVAPPSVSAGCGGIDMFMGSFSFINSDQFVAMLRNIGNNALGYAFQLAIDSMAPEIGVVLKYLQDQSSKLNQKTLNSCEAGRDLVNSTIGDAIRARKRQAADWALALNLATDGVDAEGKTRNDPNAENAAIENAKNNIPGAKELVNEGNITWRALSQPGLGLSDEEKQLLMSMVGTVIFNVTPNQDPGIEIIPKPGIMSLSTFLGRPDELGNDTVTVYRCLDGTGEDQCRNVQSQAMSTKLFGSLVNEKLAALRDNILNRQATSQQLAQFINMAPIPVYKMLSVGTFARAPWLADNMIAKYKDVIAAEYAGAYIRVSLQTIRQAFAQSEKSRGKLEAQAIKDLLDRGDGLRAEVTQELTKAYNSVIGINNVAMEVMQYERALYASMPSHLQQSINFANSLGR